MKSRKCRICDNRYKGYSNSRYCTKRCARLAINSKKSLRRLVPRYCKVCSTAVEKYHHYCSKCLPSKQPKLRSAILKTCPTCRGEFTAFSKSKIYCKENCSPARKRQNKKHRKIYKYRQAISKKFNKEINDIYLTRPSEDYHVDHIVPKKHPNVCGLHVPWNLKILHKDVNHFKSNAFDYTMDNEKWLFHLKLILITLLTSSTPIL